jgi:hypothetical protein
MDAVHELEFTQPRSVRGILAATAQLYNAYPLLFLILALAVMAPYELGVLAITGYGPLRHGHENIGTYWLLDLLRLTLITPLIAALHMHAVAAVKDGRRPHLRAVAMNGLRVLPVVAAAEVMSNIGIVLGSFALIIPGLLLSFRWSVVAQAATMEGGGWLDALRSSRRLTATHYGHIFGLVLFGGALAFVVLLGARAIPLGSTTGVASVAVGIVLDTAVASFAALTLALLYYDLQARAEAPANQQRVSPPASDAP